MANLHTVAVANELASRTSNTPAALTPGTYKNAQVVVNSSGDVESIVNGPQQVQQGSGSFTVLPGGAVMQWGKSNAAGTGGPSATVAVVFPKAYTNPPIVICNPDNRADGTGNFPFTCIPSSVTNTGFNADFNCEVQIGGGGAAGISNVVHANWIAIGN